jgi:beta-phosphoglucomutase
VNLIFKTLHQVPHFADLLGLNHQLKALIFDMDGTLFNTEIFHAKALMELGKRHNIKPPCSPDEVYELMVGKADHLLFEIIKNWNGIPPHWTTEVFINEKNSSLLSIMDEVKENHFFPQMTQNLLQSAYQHGIKLALVTSSEKCITDKLLEMTKISHLFDLILTRDDCPFHKPHPWPYLKALEVLNISQNETFIFEDSHVGIESALASGAKVFKVNWF